MPHHGPSPIGSRGRPTGLGELALLRPTRRQRAAGAVNASRDERAVVLVLVNQDDDGGFGAMQTEQRWDLAWAGRRKATAREEPGAGDDTGGRGRGPAGGIRQERSRAAEARRIWWFSTRFPAAVLHWAPMANLRRVREGR